MLILVKVAPKIITVSMTHSERCREKLKFTVTNNFFFLSS